MQVAQNYLMQAAEAGNANAMAFLGKVLILEISTSYFRRLTYSK